MKRTSILCIAAFLFIFSASSVAQDGPSGIDHYMETGKTIFIAKCVSVGPVNKLLRAEVRLDVIHVVKGANLPPTISVIPRYGMVEGKTYLLRSVYEFSEERPRLEISTRESVIPIPEYTDMAKLLSLSPRLIVLRTINMRIDRLESEINSLQFELDTLKAARKD